MSCPSFANSTAVELRKHAVVARIFADVCYHASYTLAGSLFLAPLAPYPLALGGIVTVLMGNCTAQGSVRELALDAVIGIDIMLSICTLAGPALLPITAILVAAKSVIVPLSQGKPPSGTALFALIGALGSASDDPDTQKKISDAVALADGNSESQLRKRLQMSTVKEQAQRNLKTTLSNLPVTTPDYRPELVAAAQNILTNNSKGLSKSYLGTPPQPIAWLESIKYLQDFVNTPAVPWSHSDALKAISNPASAKTSILASSKSNTRIIAIVGIGAAVVVVGIIAIRRFV